MRLLMCAAALLAVLAVTWPAVAGEDAVSLAATKNAGSLYSKGRDAEAQQDYVAAYEAYKAAYALKPKDLRFRASAERTKFYAAAALVHKGQQLRDEGKLEEALEQFQKARDIDSSNFLAGQELRRTQAALEAQRNGGSPQTVLRPASPSAQRLSDALGPADLAPVSNTPVSLQVTEDTKVIYETVGKLAGINVLFDPDYTARRIKVSLNGVTLREALEIIALESKTFWRPVTSNTIYVASDTQAKRKEVEQNVIKTFYLSNISTQTELQDIVNALRTVLEIGRVIQLVSQNAIIVRGTPDQVALAEKIIGDVDKAKSEVVVDIAVMQVSKDKMRNLGISPPTKATVTLEPNLSSTSSSTTGTGTGTTGSTSTTGGLNLNRLANLNATDFTVNIDPATVQALFSDSATKIIQKPQIRALDGQKATLKIGDRIPVATGSFQPGIGSVGTNSLVNTQFNYQDVGVNVDITPTVHSAAHEVTLKLVLEVSSVTQTTNLGGINQPVIGQRKIEHTIRLKDGEVNLLGGILEETDTKALTGFPLLSQIPILKYLFSSTNTEHRENEIVIAIVPHIVRGLELTSANDRMVDMGTSNQIYLRSGGKQLKVEPPAPTKAPTSAPPAQPQATTTPQGGPSANAATPANGGKPNAANPLFSFDPLNVTQAAGTTFVVNLNITGAQGVHSVPVQLAYDPKVLHLVTVSNGGFLAKDGQIVTLTNRDDGNGLVQMAAMRPAGAEGISGNGSVFAVTFQAVAPGNAVVSIARGGVRDASQQMTPVPGAQAMITVR